MSSTAIQLSTIPQVRRHQAAIAEMSDDSLPRLRVLCDTEPDRIMAKGFDPSICIMIIDQRLSHSWTGGDSSRGVLRRPIGLDTDDFTTLWVTNFVETGSTGVFEVKPPEALVMERFWFIPADIFDTVGHALGVVSVEWCDEPLYTLSGASGSPRVPARPSAFHPEHYGNFCGPMPPGDILLDNTHPLRITLSNALLADSPDQTFGLRVMPLVLWERKFCSDGVEARYLRRSKGGR
jgi:hypothetical protein